MNGEGGIFPYESVTKGLTGLSKIRQKISGENPVELRYQQVPDSLPTQIKNLFLEIGNRVKSLFPK